MESVSIGLDIGSTAVRAAEVEVSAGQRMLRRYGQVGLPRGCVVDGEVVNPIAVSEAIRRLWAEGGFRSHKVVVGVSGPRVFVRQAELPVMSVEDLRSSLRFDGQELVPIPLDDASFDVGVLDPGSGRPSGAGSPADGGLPADGVSSGGSDSDSANDKMRVLLVAAHRDALRSYLDVVKAAGLTPVAMDSSALALLRAVPSPVAESGSLEVVVSIGAELTTVGVRHQGVPRFIRTLTVGGSKLTASLASSAQLELAVAERVKRNGLTDDLPSAPQIRKAFSTDVRDLAEDVRATIDFFTAQADEEAIDRLLITGGAAQTEGLAAAIGGSLPVEVLRVPAFAGFDTTRLDLDAASAQKAADSATTAIGLALWPFEAPLLRLSVLPEEIARARRTRRTAQLAAAGVVGLAVILGAVGYATVQRTHDAQSQAHEAQQEVTTLTSEVARLQAATAVHGQMESRQSMVEKSLTGDVDWVEVLGRLAGVMPSDLHLTSFSGQRQTGSGSTTSGVGTASFSLSGSGNETTAGSWLSAIQSDPDFEGSWVGGISVGTGSQGVSFSSTSSLTSAAESDRAKEVNP